MTELGRKVKLIQRLFIYLFPPLNGLSLLTDLKTYISMCVYILIMYEFVCVYMLHVIMCEFV